jgi:hypothetical protein
MNHSQSPNARFLELGAPRETPSELSDKRFVRNYLAALVGLTALSSGVYFGYIRPRINDNLEYTSALSKTAQVRECESVGNILRAEQLENQVWGYIGRVERDGTWVDSSKIEALKQDLNTNHTKGAKVGESLD